MLIKNALNDFSEDVFRYLVGKPKTGRSLLVKKHSENIHLHGDFSFPNNIQSWHECLDIGDSSDKQNDTLMKHIGKEIEDIIPASRHWALEVAKVKEEKGRIHLFLNRLKSIRVGLSEALAYNDELSQQINQNLGRVTPDLPSEDSLTSLRVKYLAKSVQNLHTIYYSRSVRDVYFMGENLYLIVTARSGYSPYDGCPVRCGVVLNAKTGVKETNLKPNDYISLRQNEMTLIAQHKYGVRVSTDSKWREYIAHLGESAVKFELLQMKPSTAVKVNFECAANGSSKGVSFILYNCARLEAILRGFNEKVADGIYPPLPPFEETDFNLLTQEDEWCLVFNFIMGFPFLLDSWVRVNAEGHHFRPDLICSFLCSLVKVVSQYYRKVRILTEPRKHLLPVMFARLHLLKILNDTMKTCLNILDIKSVSQMY